MKRSQIPTYTPKILTHLVKGEILVLAVLLKIDAKARKLNESYFKDGLRPSQFPLGQMKSSPHYAYSQYELCIDT